METPPAPIPSSPSSSTGLAPNTAAALAYLAWWVSGAIILVLERDNRFVRFHAMQSIAGLGGVWLVGLILWLAGFPMLLVSATMFRLLMLLAQLVWVAGLVLWVICLFKAYNGEWWKMPVAGEVAERWLTRAS